VSKKLLIVWVYYPAAGHLVEAFEVAANYKNANPDLKIYILVHQDTPYQIGNYCNFIDAIYPIDINHCLETIDLSPDDFDYVVFQKRLKFNPQDFPGPLLACNMFFQKYFKAKIWSGYDDTPDENPLTLKAQPYSPFKLNIPKHKITFTLPKQSGHPTIAIMLKGASRQTIWPSWSLWRILCLRIKKEYPNAVFLITGISSNHTTPKTIIGKFKQRLDRFITTIPGALNCYDVGLENQLGLIQQADIFLAPHTGFSFFAPCLGTPWLALSGGEWSEHMLAKQPFYNVLPTCIKYPCHGGDKTLECKIRMKLKQPIKCMSDLIKKQDEVLIGLKKLLDGSYTFEEAFVDYENSAIINSVNMKKLWRLSKYKDFNSD
jgi:hypothetical protein